MNYSELLQLVKGWSNLVSNRIIIWRLPLKYHPNYQPKGFETLEEAREWVSLFVKWYNHDHHRSGLNFLTLYSF